MRPVSHQSMPLSGRPCIVVATQLRPLTGTALPAEEERGGARLEALQVRSLPLCLRMLDGLHAQTHSRTVMEALQTCSLHPYHMHLVEVPLEHSHVLLRPRTMP